jgi:hypothetical protein
MVVKNVENLLPVIMQGICYADKGKAEECALHIEDAPHTITLEKPGEGTFVTLWKDTQPKSGLESSSESSSDSDKDSEGSSDSEEEVLNATTLKELANAASTAKPAPTPKMATSGEGSREVVNDTTQSMAKPAPTPKMTTSPASPKRKNRPNTKQMPTVRTRAQSPRKKTKKILINLYKSKMFAGQ